MIFFFGILLSATAKLEAFGKRRRDRNGEGGGTGLLLDRFFMY